MKAGTALTKEQALLFACEIAGQTWYRELSFLYDAVAKSRRHLEVGVYCGRSLLVASYGMTKGEIVAVDSRVREQDTCVPNEFISDMTDVAVRYSNRAVTVNCVEANSIDASRTILGTFDSVFIDGGHSFEEVLSDIECWYPRVNPGGIMMGHDYWPNHWGVMDAVNRFFGDRFQVVPNTRLWYVRKV